MNRIATFTLAAMCAASLPANAVAQTPAEARRAERQKRAAEAKSKLEETKPERQAKLAEARKAFKARAAKARAQLQSQGEAIRAELAKKKARHEELVTKEKQGTITEAEAGELAAMRKQAVKAASAVKSLDAAWRKREAGLRNEQRAARRKVLLRWGAWIVHSNAAQGELDKHARRMAGLERARALAEAEGRDDLAVHVDALAKLEEDRHAARMENIQDDEGAGAEGDS